VLGHEIAHAVARHGNERMSQLLVTQLGGIALNVALSDKSQETQAAFMAAYGIGSSLGVMLPFSRMHETEADKLGMIFMAMAGYDPAESIPFLQRMADRTGNGDVAEFLSTHPSDERRVKDARNFLPNAQIYYKVR
jgi:predicted Zn-dependent protease